MVESEQGWEQLLARRRQLEQEVAAVDKVSYDWSRDLNTRLSLVHSVPCTDRWLVQGEEELDDGGGHRDQADGGHAGGAGQDTERGKIIVTDDGRCWYCCGQEMQAYNRVNTQLKLQLQLMPPEFLSEEFLSEIK